MCVCVCVTGAVIVVVMDNGTGTAQSGYEHLVIHTRDLLYLHKYEQMYVCLGS